MDVKDKGAGRMAGLRVVNGEFQLDGKDFQILSGAIHYFRVPREYWRDRLEKLLALGCNAVETYVPWNLHEPEPGRFEFSGGLDVEAFLALARDMGLKAIVRPSPYICAEFEFGGQPWWLLKDPAMRVREPGGGYEEALRRYYRELVPRLARLCFAKGGPIIACQIENEYGYYGNDKAYLGMLKDLLERNGMDALLFTTDGPWGEALEAGSLDGVLRGGSFGSGAPEHFEKMKATRPGDPLFCSEYWMGWFDAWGEAHHVRDPADAAKSLDEILERGHVNLYMFHGGTNFGFSSGSNHYEEFAPDVTSYDYDAPLSECGDPTPKYRAFREVIAERAADPECAKRARAPLSGGSFSTRISKRAFGPVPVSACVPLGAALDSVGRMRLGGRPFGMEELDQGYGYVLYRIRLSGPRRLDAFALWKCADRALVYVNGIFAAVRSSKDMGTPMALDLPSEENLIDVLVENQGRVNFSSKMNDQRKGIYGGIIVDKHAHCGVESWSLPMEELAGIPWRALGSVQAGMPGFYRAAFPYAQEEGEYHDSFLRLDGWGKGAAWINGFNLGRFWERGPQKALYLPGPLLRDGENEIVVFESEGRAADRVELVDEPDLG